MKKLVAFLLLILAQTASSEAFDIQARVAYFVPQDNRVRHIYGKNGFAEYELEASMPMMCCCECACNWDYWTNLSFYEKKGHTNCFHDRTKITNWTWNFGVKYYFDIWECVRPYLGVGVGAAHVRFHDESPFVRNHVKRWGAAFLGKAGLKYDLTCNLFLDIFADYAYNWFNFHHNHRSGVEKRNVNTGGWKLGLGVGYQF